MSQDFADINKGAGNQGGIPSSESVFQVSQTSSTEQNQQVSSPSPTSKDSIEKASAQAASLYLPPMAIPTLIPPDPNSIALATQLAMDKICITVLDNWSKSLQQIADKKREEEIRAEMNPIIQDIHMAGNLVMSVVTIFIRAIFGTNIAEALQKPNAVDVEKTVVQRFSTQLSEWSQNGILNGYLLTIIDKLPSSSNLAEENKAILSQQMEVMLLGAALGGLYKLKFNWITSAEFLALLSDPKVLEDPVSATLIQLIVEKLNTLPSSERSRMIKTLSAYMDTNPQITSFLDIGESTDIQMTILKASQS